MLKKNAFMAKHDMDVSKVPKINVASFKVKNSFLYGNEVHRQCWQTRADGKARKKNQACSGPWSPISYAPEDIKSNPDFEHKKFFL